ncbi:MAG: GAF domain-containing protein [Anaerolineales bacterium]|nr:MAG: GAF domain-containing protein [Anaerolineales bacterium]
MSREQSLEQRAASLIPLDQFIELVTHRDLEELLTDALALMIRTFNAKAGSLIFARVPPLRIRQGEFDFDKEVAEQITRWEKTIENRINSTWEIQTPRLSPITIHPLSDSGLTLLTIPLLSQMKIIGSIGLVFEVGQEPDNYQHHVLTRFVRGISNMAQLTEELAVTQQRLSQLGLLYQVGQTMASTFDLTKLLNDTLQLTTSVIDAAASALMLIDEQSNELVFEVTHGVEKVVVPRERISLDEGIAGWVATHGEPVIVNDVSKDSRFSQKADAHTSSLTRSIAAVPLQIKGKTIGVLEVLNKFSADGFDEEDLRLILTLTTQAAIAIENARLYQSLREERDRIIQAQDDVRRELSRKLHDGTVQFLAAIAMDVEHVGRLLKLKPEAVFAELDALRKLVHQATREARIVLFELRPVILESQGLVPALRSYVNQLQDSDEFAVHLDVSNFDSQLDPKVAGTIFSIVQEAINNVKKHAHARNVWLNLAIDRDQLVVGIKDDGQGFDVKAIERDYDQRGSFGLLNMHERAELIDGFLVIESSQVEPERGTVVTLRVLLNKAVGPRWLNHKY